MARKRSSSSEFACKVMQLWRAWKTLQISPLLLLLLLLKQEPCLPLPYCEQLTIQVESIKIKPRINISTNVAKGLKKNKTLNYYTTKCTQKKFFEFLLRCRIFSPNFEVFIRFFLKELSWSKSCLEYQTCF